MNLYTKQKQTHRHRKKNLWLPKGKGRVETDKLGVWDYRFKLITKIARKKTSALNLKNT